MVALFCLAFAALLADAGIAFIAKCSARSHSRAGKLLFPLAMLTSLTLYGCVVTQKYETPKQNVRVVWKRRVVPVVETSALAQAQKESDELDARERSINSESVSVREASSSAKAKSESESRQASLAAVSQSREESAAAASSQEAAEQAASSTQDTSGADQIVTDDSQKIVGNTRTRIYHTPDQAGYRMNAANATYFDNESQAVAAGYRKSRR